MKFVRFWRAFGGGIRVNKGRKKQGGVRRILFRRAFFFALVFGGMLGSGFGIFHSSSNGIESVLADRPDVNDASVSTFERCLWGRDRVFLESVGSLQEKDDQMKECVPPANSGTVKESLRQDIEEISSGFPIESMAPAIAKYDRDIAGLIVGIAKKESNWGKRTPKLNGEECYNYWGYRGVGTRGFTPDGYGCWHRPEEAVESVGNRLQELSVIRETTEPARMVVWKCGSSCATHSSESVRKWISDVDLYYQKIRGTGIL